MASSLFETLQQAKNSVAQNKEARKQELMEALSPNKLYQNTQSGPSVNELAAPFLPSFDTTPIEETDEFGINRHSDGTYSFTDVQGNRHAGLSEKDARESQAYLAADLEAVRSGAPRETFTEYRNRLAQGTVGVGETIAKGFTGDQTLEEAANRYNAQLQDPFAVYGEELLGEEITQEQIDMYRVIQNKRAGKKALSLEELAFTKKLNYDELAKIDSQVKAAQARYKTVDTAAEDLRTFVPVNRAEEAAANAAFDVIAKNNGTVDALIDAVVNRPGTYLTQGVDSIPYMVAFTVGGPITQTGVLVSLARGRMNELTNEFIEKNGKTPTLQEQRRLEMWAAAATVAEKFGDMAAIKAIPVARWGRVQKVTSQLQGAMPKSIKKFIAAPVVALGGEALSGGLTEASEQIALTGEVSDTTELARAALAEALGTPGGIGGMVAGRAAFSVTKTATDAATRGLRIQRLQNKLSEPDLPAAQRERLQARLDELAPVQEAAPEQVVEAEQQELTPVQQEARADAEAFQAEDAQVSQEQDTSPITDESLTEALAQVDLSQDSLNRIEAFQATYLIQQLGARDLTEPQRQQLWAFSEQVDLKTGTESTPSVELGSLKDIDSASQEDMELLSLSLPDGSADRAYVETVIEAKQLEAQLEQQAPASDKSTQEVYDEVTSGGIGGRWTGFKSYLQELGKTHTAALKSGTPDALAKSKVRTDALMSQMRNLLRTREDKLTAIQNARQTPNREGQVKVVQSVKADDWSPENRRIDYVPKFIPQAEYAQMSKTDKQYLYEITSAAGPLEQILQTEIEYGQRMLQAAEQYENTSFNLEARRAERTSQRLADLAQRREAAINQERTQEISAEQIDTIGVPVNQTDSTVSETTEETQASPETVEETVSEQVTEEPSTQEIEEGDPYERHQELTKDIPKLDEESWSKQAFRANFSEIINEDGSLIPLDEIMADDRKQAVMKELSRLVGVC